MTGNDENALVRLAQQVECAARDGRWDFLEHLALTRDPSRVRIIGSSLGAVLRHDTARLEAWLAGRRWRPALFALSQAWAKDPARCLDVYERVVRRSPQTVETLMISLWRAHPSVCWREVPAIVARLRTRRQSARPIRAFVHGCEGPGRREPERALALLETLFPTRARAVRRIAAHIIGKHLLVHRPRPTVERLADWVDREEMSRVVRASFREARRYLVNGRKAGELRERLRALRAHPRLAHLV